MVRRRPSCWLLVEVLAAGCTASDARHPTPTSDQTDVWVVHHMVGHLRQTTAITLLTRDRIRHPRLRRLAHAIHQRGQAHLSKLQEWLDRRGLPAYDPQQARSRNQADLTRITGAQGKAFDLAFLKVMSARHRAGIDLAATEVRAGSLPEVRRLAQHLLTEQQAQLKQLTTWSRSSSKGSTTSSGG